MVSSPASRTSYRTFLHALLLVLGTGSAPAAQQVISGPAGSGRFGATVTALPDGHLVVTDPGFDPPGLFDAGAVHLYRPDGVRIATLSGSRDFDRVGSGGVVVLASGDFVVRSPDWDHGSTTDAGAVTFGSSGGLPAEVDSGNSLIGSSAGDAVGAGGVIALDQDRYVVVSPGWDHGSAVDAGAVSFVAGRAGVTGPVSAVNSLVGSRSGDRIGQSGITRLTGSRYLVRSAFWTHGSAAEAGAVTFIDGPNGTTGPVTPQNSLVGSSPGDRVGAQAPILLVGGNYVVPVPTWDQGAATDAGAAVFGSGQSGVAGPISADLALVGSRSEDRVGWSVTALTQGNYVVASPYWRNGDVPNVGAVTHGSGLTGVRGAVSPQNSLVGSSVEDRIGEQGVVALGTGHYVVSSAFWALGSASDAGAVTFGSGTTGIVGPVSTANSLVGTRISDRIGLNGVVALASGHYVVLSPRWEVDRGAVTFGSGITGIVGSVSAANSLVGQTADQIGSGGVTPLDNGDYLVHSPEWINRDVVIGAGAGAVTLASGVNGRVGPVTATNSLVGRIAGDRIGSPAAVALRNGRYVVPGPQWDGDAVANLGAAIAGTSLVGPVTAARALVGSQAGDAVGDTVIALPQGDYLVHSPAWRNGSNSRAGALTLGAGPDGVRGPVSAANSLVGSRTDDLIGSGGIVPLDNGHYVVVSPFWDHDTLSNAGAITLGLADGSVTGPISTTHSVLGEVAEQGQFQPWAYDAARNQLVVGQPASNRVVLHRSGLATTTILAADRGVVDQPVTFSATVAAAPNGPVDGQVRIEASTGQSCIASTPTPISATETTFTCTLSFDAVGEATVIAEYTGSIRHAWSRSDPFVHTTLGQIIHVDGFEAP